MLLESRTVYVPAQAELDAERNDEGGPSVDCMAQFGEAACQAGAPDYGVNDAETDITDTIANLLHYARKMDVDIDTVLCRAQMHFEAER